MYVNSVPGVRISPSPPDFKELLETVTPFSFVEPSLSVILFVTASKIAIPPAPEAPLSALFQR